MRKIRLSDEVKKLSQEVKELKKEVEKTSTFRKRIYTLKEASYVLGVSYSQMQKLVSSGEVSHSKPSGKLVFIKRKDLEYYAMRSYIKSNDMIDESAALKVLNNKMV